MIKKPITQKKFRFKLRPKKENRGVQREFLELHCEVSGLAPFEAKDIIELASSEKAPKDAVFRTGGKYNGKWQEGRWICAWELGGNNTFIDYANKRLSEERKGEKG